MTILEKLGMYEDEPSLDNEAALLAALTQALAASQDAARSANTAQAASIAPADFQALTDRVSAIEALFRSAALQTTTAPAPVTEGKGLNHASS
jgi:hypothetical protein